MINIAELIGGGRGSADGTSGKSAGMRIAEVTNISDPDDLGRVLCKPISLDEDVTETDWCFYLTPWGGGGYGFFAFPNVGDLVILAYIDGDVHRPVVMGSLWQGKTAAPYKIESGKNEIVSLKSPKGVEIKLELTEGSEKVSITTPSGALFKIDDGAKSVTLSDGGGENALSMELEGGVVRLKAKTEINISAGKTAIRLTDKGDVEINSSGSIKAESAQIEIKASSAFKAEGADSQIKAGGQLTLQSSGTAALKGAMVQIN